ncbi:hypothetical protein GTY54_48030, partial [Streptomyces sp. SID625]|nr:hypothetical protein [Streptomyces sp. SID625]
MSSSTAPRAVRDVPADGWTLEEPGGAPVYSPADPQSGRALVEWHLHRLGLGPHRLTADSGAGYRIARHVPPPGRLGVCRARTLTEAAWPRGADLCVLVDWSPDPALRRNPHHGTLPPGAEDHWRDRITATARALRSAGYHAEPSPVRCSPRHHASAELLVYRMPPGTARRPAPEPDTMPEPLPPTYERPRWSPERPPAHVVEAALRAAGLPLDGAPGDSAYGQVTVRAITQTVWPPGA